MRNKLSIAVLNLLATATIVLFTILQLAGQNSLSPEPAKESRHFRFHSTQGDIKVLDSLATTLENNYSRITNRLGVQIDEKINVKVFPDVKSFHAAINQPGSPDWVVGVMDDSGLMMVSPLNPGSVHTYESLMQVIVHEFVHLAVSHAMREKGVTEIPRWLNEGYAMYESGQLNDLVRKSVKSTMNHTAPPTWSQLNNVPIGEFGSMNGYGFSATIVEFLANTYGIDKLALLVSDAGKIELIYCMPRDTLEKQWVMYLKE